MTANQVAMAGVNETARHNKMLEDETAMHNRAVEAIQEEANAINARATEHKIDYENRMQQWKEEYDKLYLNYQSATTWEKLRLEQEMNNIQMTAKTWEHQHNVEMENLQAQANRIQSKHEDELARHNKEQERLTGEANANEARKIDFEHSHWQEMDRISWFHENWNRDVSLWNAETNSGNLNLRKEELDWQKSYGNRELQLQGTKIAQDAQLIPSSIGKQKSEAFRNYVNGFVSIGDLGLDVAKSLFNPFNVLGGTNGAKKEFENLFK